MSESLEDKVERIAKAWYESPCSPEEDHCNPELHIWDRGHPDDKEYAKEHVRFVLEHLDG